MLDPLECGVFLKADFLCLCPDMRLHITYAPKQASLGTYSRAHHLTRGLYTCNASILHFFITTPTSRAASGCVLCALSGSHVMDLCIELDAGVQSKGDSLALYLLPGSFCLRARVESCETY